MTEQRTLAYQREGIEGYGAAVGSLRQPQPEDDAFCRDVVGALRGSGADYGGRAGCAAGEGAGMAGVAK